MFAQNQALALPPVGNSDAARQLAARGADMIYDSARSTANRHEQIPVRAKLPEVSTSACRIDDDPQRV
jgi:hypothetical protein